jgi:hypothetical protein
MCERAAAKIRGVDMADVGGVRRQILQARRRQFFSSLSLTHSFSFGGCQARGAAVAAKNFHENYV